MATNYGGHPATSLTIGETYTAWIGLTADADAPEIRVGVEGMPSLDPFTIGDDVVRVKRPEIKGASPVTNNVGDEATKLQNRFSKVNFGEPVYKAGLTRLTRPRRTT